MVVKLNSQNNMDTIFYLISFPEIKLEYKMEITQDEWEGRKTNQIRKLIQAKGLNIAAQIRRDTEGLNLTEKTLHKMTIEIETAEQALIGALENKGIINIPHKFRYESVFS